MDNIVFLKSLMYACPFQEAKDKCAIRNLRNLYLIGDSQVIDCLSTNQIRSLCTRHKTCFDKRANLLLYNKYFRDDGDRNSLPQIPNRRLTKQEKKVAKLLAAGASVKDIANILGLSAHTIANYRKSIFSKLDVHNAVSMVWKCILIDVL